MTAQLEATQLVDRLGRDDEFAAALDADPLAALHDGGFAELGRATSAERDRIAELVDRIYDDEEFRRELEQDPAWRLSEWGIPEEAVEPILIAIGAPDEVVDRATADVEAHGVRKPATVATIAAVLGALAFAQQATAGGKPETSTQITNPATSLVISRPEAIALSRPEAPAPVGRPTHIGWMGIDFNRVTMRSSVAAYLGAQSSVR